MNVMLRVALATGLVLGMVQPAQAVTVSKSLFVDPSTSCQLSIPTTNTGVRPRATGYRNEGANAFVICGTSMFAWNSPTSIQLQFIAFDGVSHDISCTAVTRDSGGACLGVYSTKALNVVSGTTNSIVWSGADFGGGFEGFANSVTCTLPGGVAITGTRITFPDEVGS